MDEALAQDQNESLIEALARRAATREELAVSGSTSLALSARDAAWNASAAAKSLDPADYGKAFFWTDPDGDPETLSAYKLGFASKASGALTAIFRGVTAAAGAVQGARGGVQIPEADVAGVKSRIAGYYSKAAKKYADDSIKPPWEANEAEGETAAFLLAYAECVTDGLDIFRSEDGTATVGVGGSGPAMDAFLERRAFWDAQFAMTAEDAALEQMAETLAMAACANCDHAFADHLGSEGPCTAEDCSCNGYAAPADGDEAATAADEFEPSDELALALRVVGNAATSEAKNYIRLQLQDFQIVAAGDPVADTLPDAHQPGARAPRTKRGVPEPSSTVTGPFAWSAILAPEGKLTSDRRTFAPGSITWRELPLTLMAMLETGPGGHEGAFVAGRIDEIWRDEAAGLIRAKGVFSGDRGAEVAGLVEDRTLRGNSVDLAIGKYVTGPRSEWFDEDGNWAPAENAAEPSLLDLYSDDTIAVVLEAEIGMSTVCPFPAFAEAQIAMGDSLVAGANPAFWTVTQEGGWTVEECQECQEALIASAGVVDELEVSLRAAFLEPITASAAGLAPVAPPAAWFENPELEGPTPITIEDDGRIFGHAAVWGVCHIGFPGSCRTAPHSDTDYLFFHLGEVLCEDGERLPCGQITLDAPHADLKLDRSSATAHYDHTGTVVAHVRCGEDEHGIWVAGAIQPDAPAEKVRLLRGSKLSGDWRGGELVALLCVNVPGFPVPRAQALAASIEGAPPEVVSLVAAGIPVFETELTPEEVEQFAALREHLEFAALAEQAA